MTYKGTFKNGVVVFRRTPALRNGQAVQVKAASAPRRRKSASKRPRRGTAAALLRHAGTWAGDPAELDRLLEDLRRSKWAEVAAERKRLGLPPDPDAPGAPPEPSR